MREGSEEYLIVYRSTSIVVVKGVGIWQYLVTNLYNRDYFFLIFEHFQTFSKISEVVLV